MNRDTNVFEPPKLLLDKCDFCGQFIFAGEQSVSREKKLFCRQSCERADREQPSAQALANSLSDWFQDSETEQLADIDPINLEVFVGAFRSTCLEMGNTMIRTAHSPVFYEGEDFTCAIFDADLCRVALWEGNPAQLGSLEYGVRAAIAQFGWDDIYEGDVILHNNSYVGTPHLPEFLMTKPVFHEGRVIAVVATIAHHTDVGGKEPGGMPGDATDIHQEGVLIPPVKAFERGKAVDSIWRVILSNMRTPQPSYGDFLAMVGSVEIGERRTRELVARYGVETVLEYMKAVQRHAERHMRAEIERIPNGVYESEILLSDDGVTPNRPYLIKVAITVLDRDVLFDFRGSDVQARGPVNCPFGVTVAGSINALYNLVDPMVPRNQGAYVPMHFVIPRATVLNCEYPAPLNAGNSETHNVIAECCLAALAEAVPDRVIAPSGATVSLFSGGGIDEKHERFVFITWESIGWGAASSRDGGFGIAWVGVRSRTYSTEVLESRFPWRIEYYEIRPDSGGAGRFRGGFGVERRYRFLGDEMTLNAVADYFLSPAQGWDGGGPGATTDIRIIEASGTEKLVTERPDGGSSASKFSGIWVDNGEGFLIRTAGGGGYGDPRQRDRAQVLDDVFDGYVTPERAVELYEADKDEVARAYARSWAPFRARFRDAALAPKGDRS